MKFLPYENITYRSKLSNEEILTRLRQNIEPRKAIRMTGIFGDNNHKPYQGSIEWSAFNITRIISYRNSFLPKISGEVIKDYHGSKINVKMRLHWFVIAFIAVWCSGVGFACVTIFFSMIDERDFDAFSLIPFLMLLFLYGMVMGGFKYESSKSKKFLSELFEAEIEDN